MLEIVRRRDVLRLTAHRKVIDDFERDGIDHVDAIATAVRDVNPRRESRDGRTQITGTISRVDVVGVQDRGHAGKRRISCRRGCGVCRRGCGVHAGRRTSRRFGRNGRPGTARQHGHRHGAHEHSGGYSSLSGHRILDKRHDTETHCEASGLMCRQEFRPSYTQSSIAHFTASRWRHGPRRRITSVLYRPMIDSASALSYAARPPTDGAMAGAASRRPLACR